jgi:hypothetical protein
MVTGRGRSSCISSHIYGLDKQEKIKGQKIRCWHVDFVFIFLYFVIKIIQVEEVSWIVSCIFSSFLRLLHNFLSHFSCFLASMTVAILFNAKLVGGGLRSTKLYLSCNHIRWSLSWVFIFFLICGCAFIKKHWPLWVFDFQLFVSCWKAS